MTDVGFLYAFLLPNLCKYRYRYNIKFIVLFKAVCKPACANGGSCVIAGDTRSNATLEDQGKCT